MLPKWTAVHASDYHHEHIMEAAALYPTCWPTLCSVAAAVAAAATLTGRCRVAMRVPAGPAVHPKCVKLNIDVDTWSLADTPCA